ncbi:serine/threonine-protein kinase [Leifsonia sp. A12D58]|uniref:serine/threonine-protein kinase n=1 Tax=Leifsonia sp. A12D58 TaxID=3397674 RepID=UPI0039E06F0A
MTTRRLPSAPPNLSGFSYVRALGSGGFADVFLFEQSMPRRQVAVKVLLTEVVNDRVRQLFQAEANLMAQLSSHPAILTVYQAGVSSDGRPYLVMEYCSATLSQRYRSEALPVPEVLRIGVKIASAVETAHRAGVLHRDIKPSNILITAYGHPVLSDFGIAATLGDAEETEAMGLSIPWSAPEVLFDEVSGSVAAEVWSLGATLYSLLAGRSPFEQLGTDNTPAELMARIAKAKVPPLDRPDVPGRLEAALRKAMSKRPEQRQQSVLELIRELQSAEAELGLVQTPLEVSMDDWAQVSLADPDDKTRISAVRTVEAASTRRRRKPSGALTKPRSGTLPSHSLSNQSGSGDRSATRGSRAGLVWGMVALAAVMVSLAAVGVTMLTRTAAADIPTVNNIDGTVSSGVVVFSWDDPGIRAGDSYVVTLGSGESSMQRSTEFSIDPRGDDRVCVTVAVNREGRTGAASGQKCVDVASESTP